MKIEAEIGAMQCEERQQSPGAGRGNDGSFLRDSGRTATLVHSNYICGYDDSDSDEVGVSCGCGHSDNGDDAGDGDGVMS